ncbi:methyltransferase domain-containing protein [archaeon]|nr:methyltransferase domain-containing protein [archaeon]
MNRMLDGVKSWNDFSQLKQIDEVFVKYAKYLKGKDALDIGCCYGRSSLIFAEQGLNVTGIDADPAAVEKFNMFAAEKNLPAKAYCISATDYVFDREWDAIICEGMLHFLPQSDAYKMIEKIQDATCCGGLNLIATFTTEGEAFKGKKTKTNGFLCPGYLETLYKDPSWKILNYWEVPSATRKEKNGIRLMQVASEVIARKVADY